MTRQRRRGAEGLSAGDLALDHRLALLSESYRFLLDITPVDADDLRDDFLAGRLPDPGFTYRELETDPEVVRAELDSIDLGEVDDPVLAQLLRAKHREMGIQLDMLGARDTDDFLPLSVELYGGVSPSLREQADRCWWASPAPRRRARRWTPRSSSRWPTPRSRATARRTPTSRCTRRSAPTSTASWSPATSCSSGRRPRSSRARAGAAPPRGRHAPRHPGQRHPPADQGARRRARRL